MHATNDRGLSPFADDTSTSREIAFAKVKNRVEGKALQERIMWESICLSIDSLR
jgi:5-methyltetrahydropteroyltriglutamate--homocysteine methyltransferase